MKESTREDYVRLVYKVVFYIEQNADRELNLEELAKVAGFSKYHFHCIFKAVREKTSAILSLGCGCFIRRGVS